MNPADVRGTSVSSKAAGRTLQAFLDSPEYDAIVMLFARPLIDDAAGKAAQSIAAIARNSNKPVIVIWSGQRRPVDALDDAGAWKIFRNANIPIFTQPSSFLRAYQRLNRYHQYRELFLHDFQIGSGNG